jgi:uncharacterized protein (DUF58 family)
MTVNARRPSHLPPDRGGRQHLKIMQLLAALEPDGESPLVESLVQNVGRLRRGMTAVIITASLDPAWVRVLATLRGRGVACVVVLLDALAYDRVAQDERAALAGERYVPDPEVEEAARKRLRALRHALAEYELKTYIIEPGRPLGEVLTR